MDAFIRLNAVNCNGHTEKKNGLTYLSWAWAWAEVKKMYPASYYTVYENRDGWNYFTDGRTCWVKTGVTIVDGEESLEHIEFLPVMDFKNKSIPANAVTSFDVNKAIQRSLTKACARHGLGLYIYAGEDLPEEAPAADAQMVNLAGEQIHTCQNCGAELTPITGTKGQTVSVDEQIHYSLSYTGNRILCPACLKKARAEAKAAQEAEQSA